MMKKEKYISLERIYKRWIDLYRCYVYRVQLDIVISLHREISHGSFYRVGNYHETRDSLSPDVIY